MRHKNFQRKNPKFKCLFLKFYLIFYCYLPLSISVPQKAREEEEERMYSIDHRDF